MRYQSYNLSNVCKKEQAASKTLNDLILNSFFVFKIKKQTFPLLYIVYFVAIIAIATIIYMFIAVRSYKFIYFSTNNIKIAIEHYKID